MRDRAAAPNRTVWRRLASAQESGLVVVIALMMMALTFFGSGAWPGARNAMPAGVQRWMPSAGPKTASIRVDIPKGAKVEEISETDLSVTIGSDGPVLHRSEAAWRVREQDDGSKVAFGSQTENRFLNTENLIIVTTNASFIAIMAVGMTAIIVLAGIDLSIGSIYALAAILGGMVLAKVNAGAGPEGMSGWSAVPILLIVCGAAGAAGGFINGIASVALRVHPFIITLGTMAIYRGLVFVITEGQTVSGLPESVQKGFFKLEKWGVYPVPTIIMILVAIAGMFVLSRTVFGRRIYAIGGNELAAKYAGIPVGRIKTIVYTLSGMLVGLSASIYVGYYGAAESNAGQGYELKVIAAAVIGGASLSGGRGSAIGAVLGAILVELINNGMVILGIDQSYNQIVMGLAIVIAVVVDQTKSRFTAR